MLLLLTRQLHQESEGPVEPSRHIRQVVSLLLQVRSPEPSVLRLEGDDAYHHLHHLQNSIITRQLLQGYTQSNSFSLGKFSKAPRTNWKLQLIKLSRQPSWLRARNDWMNEWSIWTNLSLLILLSFQISPIQVLYRIGRGLKEYKVGKKGRGRGGCMGWGWERGNSSGLGIIEEGETNSSVINMVEGLRLMAVWLIVIIIIILIFMIIIIILILSSNSNNHHHHRFRRLVSSSSQLT